MFKSLALIATACAFVACAEVPVVQGVPESEANRVVAALDRVGIEAHKSADEGGAASGGAGAEAPWRVTVEREDVARAIAAMQAQGLPRRGQSGVRETYGQGSLVPGVAEERARSAHAIAGELARSIESIDGVLDARVHLATADVADVPLDSTTPPRSTASVLIRYAGSRAPYDEEAIRRLVAGGVAGLRADDVAVVSIARPLAPARADAAPRRFGPLAVSRSTLATLYVVAGALLGAVMGASAMFAFGRRRGGGRQESPAEEPPAKG